MPGLAVLCPMSAKSSFLRLGSANFMEARFWIASSLPTNRELPHSWTQARLSLLIFFELPSWFLDE